MKRRRVSAVTFTLAAILLPAALFFSIDPGNHVPDLWLGILWGAGGATFLIGLVTMDFAWSRLTPVALAARRRAGRVRERVPYEIVRRRRPAAKEAPLAQTGAPAVPSARDQFATEVEQRAAEVAALWTVWESRIAAHERFLTPPGGEPSENGDPSGQMFAEYLLKYRASTRDLFRRLMTAGVVEPEHESLIADPQDAPGGLVRVAEVLNEAAERLRERPAPHPAPPKPAPAPRTPNDVLRADLLNLLSRGRKVRSLLKSDAIIYNLGEKASDWEGEVLDTLEAAGRPDLVDRFGEDVPFDLAGTVGAVVVPGSHVSQKRRIDVLLGRLTQIVREL